MPSPTEKALRQVLVELKAQRKANETLAEKVGVMGNAIDGFRVALAEFHSDIQNRHQVHENAVNQMGVRVTRAERALKLKPA